MSKCAQDFWNTLYNGTFVGVTEDGSPAKTVLAFVVQSLADKYKYGVYFIPVNKLDTALLRAWFDQVMVALNDMFQVLAVSTDIMFVIGW